jgi:hypothetical protein
MIKVFQLPIDDLREIRMCLFLIHREALGLWDTSKLPGIIHRLDTIMDQMLMVQIEEEEEARKKAIPR